jgi:hypothetical protein
MTLSSSGTTRLGVDYLFIISLVNEFFLLTPLLLYQEGREVTYIFGEG